MIITNATGFYKQQSRVPPREFVTQLTVDKATFQAYYGFMSDDSANGPFGAINPINQWPSGPPWGQNYAFSNGDLESRAYGASATGQARRFLFPDGSPINTLVQWFSNFGPPLTDDAGLAQMPWNATDLTYEVHGRVDIYNHMVSQRDLTFGIYIEGLN